MSKSSHIHRVSNSLPMTTERAPRSNLFHKMQPNELNTFMGLYRFLYGPHRTLNQSIEIPRDNNDIIMFLLMSSSLHKGCLSQHSRVVFYLIRVSAPLLPQVTSSLDVRDLHLDTSRRILIIPVNSCKDPDILYGHASHLPPKKRKFYDTFMSKIL